MKRNGTLELEGMEFHACHGCLGHEKMAGNLFTVDFKATVDMSAAASSDSLEDALDYGRKDHGGDRKGIPVPGGVLRQGLQAQAACKRGGGMVQGDTLSQTRLNK